MADPDPDVLTERVNKLFLFDLADRLAFYSSMFQRATIRQQPHHKIGVQLSGVQRAEQALTMRKPLPIWGVQGHFYSHPHIWSRSALEEIQACIGHAPLWMARMMAQVWVCYVFGNAKCAICYRRRKGANRCVCPDKPVGKVVAVKLKPILKKGNRKSARSKRNLSVDFSLPDSDDLALRGGNGAVEDKERTCKCKGGFHDVFNCRALVLALPGHGFKFSCIAAYCRGSCGKSIYESLACRSEGRSTPSLRGGQLQDEEEQEPTNRHDVLVRSMSNMHEIKIVKRQRLNCYCIGPRSHAEDCESEEMITKYDVNSRGVQGAEDDEPTYKMPSGRELIEEWVKALDKGEGGTSAEAMQALLSTFGGGRGEAEDPDLERYKKAYNKALENWPEWIGADDQGAGDEGLDDLLGQQSWYLGVYDRFQEGMQVDDAAYMPSATQWPLGPEGGENDYSVLSSQRVMDPDEIYADHYRMEVMDVDDAIQSQDVESGVAEALAKLRSMEAVQEPRTGQSGQSEQQLQTQVVQPGLAETMAMLRSMEAIQKPGTGPIEDQD